MSSDRKLDCGVQDTGNICRRGRSVGGEMSGALSCVGGEMAGST
jgi:hypothetical protein